MPDASRLRESARSFAAAAKNASDPRLKRAMLAQARNLSRLAKSGQTRSRQRRAILIDVKVGAQSKA